MAFNANEMAQMAYSGAAAGGHHLYWYSNSDADDVTAANYFDAYSAQMSEGDVIFDLSARQFFQVSDITSGAVTVTQVLQPAT